MFIKESQNLADEWSIKMQKCCKNLKVENSDAFFKSLQVVKDDKQVLNMKIASSFINEWTKDAVLDFEDWFSNEKSFKHMEIANK